MDFQRCGGSFTGNSGANPGTATYTASSGSVSSVTLTLTTSGGSCGTTSATTSLVVNPNPTVGVASVAAICQGGTTAALGGTFGGGATSAVWTSSDAGGSFTGNGGANPGSATYTASSGSVSSVTLTLTTSGGSCSTTSATTSLVVNPNPTVGVASVAAICQGGTTAALGGSFGGGATSAVWTSSDAGGSFTGNGGANPGSATYTASSGSVSSVTLTLTTSGGSCGTTSANTVLVVNPTPSVTVPISVTAICQGGTTAGLGGSYGGSATAAVWTSSDPNGSFSDNGGSDPGGTTYIASAGSPTPVTLTLTSVGGLCTAASATVTLVVNPLPATGTITNGNQSVCAGYETAAPYADAAPGGVWSSDNTSVATVDVSGNVYAVSSGTANIIYTVTSASLCVATTSSPITVNPLPNNVNPTTYFAYTVTGGGPYCLGGSGSIIGLGYSDAGIIYQLYNGSTAVGAPLSGANSAISWGYQTAAGTYTVVATNPVTGCYDNMPGSPVISVNPIPDVTVADQTVCNGATQPEIDFSGSVVGTSFSWANSNTGIGLGAGGATGSVCGYSAEGGSVTLTAPAGAVFTSVNFASFGTPGGDCTGGFTIGGCNAPNSMSVVQSYLLGNTGSITIPANNNTFTDPCYGTVKALAIQATYTYTGNVPSFTATNTGSTPTAGTITVTPTANGCEGTPATFNINVNPSTTIAPVANITQGADANLCSAVVDYSAAIVTTAASSTTYSFSGATPGSGSGSGAPSAFNVGTTVVTVTVTNECNTASTTFSVIVTPNILSVAVGETDVSCNTANGDLLHSHSDGTLSTVVSGGTASTYVYTWTGGASGANPSGLPIGSYSVSVTDPGCPTEVAATGSATIGQPTALAITAITPKNISCNNGNGDLVHGHSDGSITTTVSGGTGGDLYLWSNGETSSNDVGLTATATYGVTVTDGNGCTTTGSATVGQPTAITYSTVTATNISCNNGNGGTHNNGTATVNGAIGGTGTLSYLWSNSETTNPATGLTAPATYGVTITDLNGCTTTGSATVGQPTAMVFSTTVDNVSCYGGYNGYIDADVSGGTPGYSYSWHTGGIGYASYDDLYYAPAGTYSVTVTDAHSCTLNGSYTITQPAALTLSAVTANVSCHGGNNGSITTTVGGGTPGYSYSWSCSSAHGANPTGLSAGTYNVTVTDAHGCSISGSYTITQPAAALSVSGTVANVSCNGGTNGSITTSVTGGTLSYSYLWSPGAATTSGLTSKAAGTYSVTVTDGHSCTTTGSYTITQPAVLAVSGTVTNVACYGGTTGSITTSVTGGTSSYSYAWTPGTCTTANLTGKAAGTYSVTVTDAHSCKANGVYTITQPAAALNVSATVGNVTCNGGNNGSITTTVTGGTLSYSYAWSPCGGTTANLAGKTAGTYNVTVTDGHGCTTAGTYTITQPAAMTCAISVTPSTTVYTGGVPTTIYLGYGPQSATLAASATGGSGFTYSWSSTSGTTNLSSTHIANPVFTASLAGHYTYVVTITNSAGCTTTCSVSICVIDAVDHSHAGNVLLCHAYGCTPTTISCTPTQVLTHLPSHCPSDHLGPVGSTCSTSGRESGDDDEKAPVINELTVNAFPNPFNSAVNVKIQSNLMDNVDVKVYDVTGRIMETKPGQAVDADITLGQNLVPGIYIIEVKQGEEMKKVKVVKY